MGVIFTHTIQEITSLHSFTDLQNPSFSSSATPLYALALILTSDFIPMTFISILPPSP